jgi:hypothetical protein
LDFKYSHSNLYNAIIETFFEEGKNANHRVRRNELYEKAISFLNGSRKSIKKYKPSKTTFSHILKKMEEDNIVNRSTGFKHPNYVYFSLTEDAKIMRKLNILGISEQNMTFARIYEAILLSIAVSMQIKVLSKSKIDLEYVYYDKTRSKDY